MDHTPLVLCVDDDVDFLEIVRAKLAASGINVETAKDGEEGLAKARAMKPDLVLLDMKMPGMSGADMLAELKKDPATQMLKVIFISAFGDIRTEFQENDRRMAQEVGAADYIKKTEDLNVLVDKVRSFLQ